MNEPHEDDCVGDGGLFRALAFAIPFGLIFFGVGAALIYYALAR
mgnify:CR=1 FL=1